MTGKRTIAARRYSLIASIAGGIYGIVLGLLSYAGLMSGLSPVSRGVAGIITSAILGIIVTPIGVGFQYRMTKTIFIENAVVSMLSTMILWSIVYASLIG